MASTSSSSNRPETLGSLLGLPALAGHGRFVAATAIDSTGTGLILAFTIVYFVQTTSLSLVAIGAAMTLARLLALPTAMVVGPLLDRVGGRAVAAAGNVVSAAGFLGFLLVHSAWQIVIVALLVQIGHATYWTSSGALVVLASKRAEGRGRWFAFVHALRNAGMGLGGALGALVFAVGAVRGLRAIVVADAASYVLAAVLLATWRVGQGGRDGSEADDGAPDAPAAPDTPAAASPPASYRAVLRDGRYLLLIAINVTVVFAAMLISVLLAVYITQSLHRGAWIAGALLVLNTVQVAVMQTLVSRRLERYRTTRVIAAAGALFAASFAIFAALSFAPGEAVTAGLFVAMFVYTVGEMAAGPATDNLSVSMAPASMRGRYLGVYQLSWTIGQIVAPGLLTFLLAHGSVLPLMFLLSLSVATVPMALLLERLAGDSPPGLAPAAAGDAELTTQT